MVFRNALSKEPVVREALSTAWRSNTSLFKPAPAFKPRPKAGSFLFLHAAYWHVPPPNHDAIFGDALVAIIPIKKQTASTMVAPR
jgi:hypothetical protein